MVGGVAYHAGKKAQQGREQDEMTEARLEQLEAEQAAMPPQQGGSAAVALIEHRWAIPLRDKILDAGGVALADEWIHPADLVAIGAAASGDAVTTTK
jgi:hypothetical protein